MHLMEKDSACEDNDADKDQSLSEDCNKQRKANLHNCHGGKTWGQLHLLFISPQLA